MMDTVYYNYLPGILDVFNLTSQQHCKVDVIIPCLQMGILRLGKAKEFTQDYTVISNRARLEPRTALLQNLAWLGI
jgi:hypothetical protein